MKNLRIIFLSTLIMTTTGVKSFGMEFSDAAGDQRVPYTHSTFYRAETELHKDLESVKKTLATLTGHGAFRKSVEFETVVHGGSSLPKITAFKKDFESYGDVERKTRQFNINIIGVHEKVENALWMFGGEEPCVARVTQLIAQHKTFVEAAGLIMTGRLNVDFVALSSKPELSTPVHNFNTAQKNIAKLIGYLTAIHEEETAKYLADEKAAAEEAERKFVQKEEAAELERVRLKQELEAAEARARLEAEQRAEEERLSKELEENLILERARKIASERSAKQTVDDLLDMEFPKPASNSDSKEKTPGKTVWDADEID